MKSLLVENSTDTGTAALADDGEIVVRRSFSKAGELAAAIQEIFSGPGAPDEIVVGIGPGSYTGLRVASAMAIGLQLALRCPAYGCPSVLGYPESSYYVAGDARRGAIFLAGVEGGRLKRGPELMPADEFLSLRKTLGVIPIFAVGPIPGIHDLPIVHPQAEYLIRCRSSFITSLEPLYLKEPHITTRR